MAYIDDKLGDGEKAVYVAHQHPFVLVRAAAGSIGIFILGLILLIAGLVFIQENRQNSQDFLNTARIVIAIAGLITMFFGLIGFLIQYLQYVNEEYIITNERVIQVKGVFNKQELDSSLSKVNNVQTYQSLFGRIFKYGTVNIDTGNESGVNRLDYLTKPFDFKKQMLNAKNGLYGDASDLAPQSIKGGYIRTDDGERRYKVPPQAEQPPVPGGGGYKPAPDINRAEIPTMIQELARLRDSGLLTQEEFQAKKNDLLKRM
ncbi:MAG: PH domain-containing protein [Chloroflexota bacterium]|nr:PH domain-containing protein [Chloroflexota bacterium]